MGDAARSPGGGGASPQGAFSTTSSKTSRFDPEKLKQKFAKPNKLSEKFSILQEDQAKVKDETNKNKPVSDKFKHLEKKPTYGGAANNTNAAASSTDAAGGGGNSNDPSTGEGYMNQVEIDTSAPTVNTNIWGKKLKPKRESKNLTLLSWRQICEKQDAIAAKLAKYKNEAESSGAAADGSAHGSSGGGNNSSNNTKKEKKEIEEDADNDNNSDKNNDSDDDGGDSNSHNSDSGSGGGGNDGGDGDGGEMDEAALAALFGRSWHP